MASSSSQSVQAGVSDDGRQNQMETKRMEQVPNGVRTSVVPGPNMAKRHWRRWEDFKLIRHIVYHGARDWKMISDQLPGRTIESCKVRWSSTLNPFLKKPPLRLEGPLTEEQLGRTHVYVKVFYHTLMAKKYASMGPMMYSATNNVARLPTCVRNDNSIVYPGRSSHVHGEGSSSRFGNTAHDSGIHLNGPSDDGRIMGNYGICKRAMEMGGFMHAANPPPLVFPSMNSNAISLATTSSISQPQSPPTHSPPQFIDFMGVGYSV